MYSVGGTCRAQEWLFPFFLVLKLCPFDSSRHSCMSNSWIDVKHIFMVFQNNMYKVRMLCLRKMDYFPFLVSKLCHLIFSKHSCTGHNSETVMDIFMQFYKNMRQVRTRCHAKKWLSLVSCFQIMSLRLIFVRTITWCVQEWMLPLFLVYKLCPFAYFFQTFLFDFLLLHRFHAHSMAQNGHYYAPLAKPLFFIDTRATAKVEQLHMPYALMPILHEWYGQ